MQMLFQKADIKPLAIVRILIGAWFFIDCVGMMLIGWMQDAYIHAEMNFRYYGFEWVPRLPPAGMYAVFILLSIAALGIMLGYRYRLAVVTFFVCFLYVFLLDIVYDLNKFYLFLILTFLLYFMDAHRFWSLDVKRGQVTEQREVPRWNILIFQALLVMIYFYSGIAKVNPDWALHAQPLKLFLRDISYFRGIDEETFMVIAYAYSWGGMLFDLFISAFLINRRTNQLALITMAAFHTWNFFNLGIGMLSIFTALSTWLFFPNRWLKRKLGLTPAIDEPWPYPPAKRRQIVVFLTIFMVVQLSVPHRHYFTGNNVNWTEKGHRFSWRLMTRTKRGSRSLFFVKDPASGETWKINPRDHLTARQYRKMSGETDLVLVFAHYLEKKWREKGYEKVIVTAEIRTRLNGRPADFLVDPELDLTQVQRSLIVDRVSRPLKPIVSD